MNGKKAKKLRAVAAMLKDAGHSQNVTTIYKQLKKLKPNNNEQRKS